VNFTFCVNGAFRHSFLVRGIGLLFIFLLICFLQVHETFAESSSITISSKTKDSIQAAENGDSNALTFVGLKMLLGDGMPKDEKRGLMFLERAASMNNKDALRVLAIHYKKVGNLTLFEKYATKASDLGDTDSMLLLSSSLVPGTKMNSLVDGTKMKSDLPKAFILVSKAAAAGHPTAIYTLASMYYGGFGTIKNNQLALMWAYIAAAKGAFYDDKMSNQLFSLIDDLEKEFGPKASAQIRDEARKVMANISGESPLKDRETPSGTLPSNIPKQYGTGFVISENGFIVTAAHVVSKGSRIEVIVGEKKQVARVIQVDPQNDLAVLKVDDVSLHSFSCKDSSDVKVGQSVFTIGFPNIELQGSNPKVTRGDISSSTGLRDSPNCWQISVPIQTGNSGGPLLDEDGNVIGVIVSKLYASQDANGKPVPTQNVNYAVKNAYLMPMLSELGIKTHSARRKWFFESFESLVEGSKNSVVMIYVY